MSNNDDFRELSNLSELDFHEEQPEREEVEFHAPVAHTKGTSLAEKNQNEIDDYNYVRKVYLNMIESGQISLEVAINELRASGHPRAAEVVGGLIKQIADVSSQLLDINKEAGGSKQPESQTNIQNNFYGSPNDFLEEVEKAEKAAKEREESDSDNPSESFERVKDKD